MITAAPGKPRMTIFGQQVTLEVQKPESPVDGSTYWDRQSLFTYMQGRWIEVNNVGFATLFGPEKIHTDKKCFYCGSHYALVKKTCPYCAGK
jgi:hypothetical protein